MKVLITGGAGFLGSHLCDRFVTDGHEVTCLDSLLTGREANIAHLQGHSRFHFVKGDVADVALLETLGPVDAILHFASPASPVDYLEAPVDTVRAGSVGTWALLDLARARKARFLLASTSEIYGEPLVHPQTESYWGNVNPIGVRSVYDEAKRFSEMLTAMYRREFDVNTAIIRIFNTYGPRMRANDGRVVPNFVLQALRGEPITIYGDGSQTRSFCYYSDLVEGIARTLASDLHDPVNLGNPEEVSMRQLAETVLELTGGSSPLQFQPLPSDDPTRRCPDIGRARTHLGWAPTVSLRRGLTDTIDWFRRTSPP